MYRFIVDVRDGVAVLGLPTIVDVSRRIELAERSEALERDDSVGIVIDRGPVELITSRPFSQSIQRASQPEVHQKRAALASVPTNVEGIFSSPPVYRLYGFLCNCRSSCAFNPCSHSLTLTKVIR